MILGDDKMISIRLPKDLEKKLDILAQSTKRSKSFYVKEALTRYLEDIEDYYVALERFSQPGSDYYTTEEVKKEIES